MLSKTYASNFPVVSHGVGSQKLLINPLELSQCNLIHQVHFAMTAAIGKVHVECHDSVRIRNTMDSSIAGCSYKLGCIYFFQRLLISKVKYFADNYLYQIDLLFLVDFALLAAFFFFFFGNELRLSTNCNFLPLAKRNPFT